MTIWFSQYSNLLTIPSSLVWGPTILVAILIVAVPLRVIHNIWFHELSTYPGPKLWSATRLAYAYALWTGRLHYKIKNFHDQYGQVVRIAPDELSFISSNAWKHIYSGQNGNKGYPKHRAYTNAQGFESLFDATDSNHTYMRKLLKTRYFSAQAIDKHEAIIQEYAGHLIDRLKQEIQEQSDPTLDETRPNKVVNIQKWFNFATFDLAGKLTLGEDFGCLDQLTYHPWVEMVLVHFKLSALAMVLRFYHPLDRLLNLLAPISLQRLRAKFLSLAKEKISARLSRDQPDSTDFVAASLQESTAKNLSRDMLEANCILLIIAGSETMATSLISALNVLCKNALAFQRLVDEIRSFKQERSMTHKVLAELPYLNAVLKEVHRLYPPLANGPARVIDQDGAWISCNFVPAGTAVGVTQYAAFRSASNFNEPECFVPERWLDNADLTQSKNSKFAPDRFDVVRPFSYGARDCLGQNIAMAEFRILLARFLWAFDVQPISKFDFSVQKAFMLWQKQPFWIQLNICNPRQPQSIIPDTQQGKRRHIQN